MLYMNFRVVRSMAGGYLLIFCPLILTVIIRGGTGYEMCSVLLGPEFERGK